MSSDGTMEEDNTTVPADGLLPSCPGQNVSSKTRQSAIKLDEAAGGSTFSSERQTPVQQICKSDHQAHRLALEHSDVQSLQPLHNK